MAAPAQATPTAPAAPQVLVAVNLRIPQFLVRDVKYRVLFVKAENKFIPIEGYDFGAALTDELINALSEDKRWTWRAPAAEEKSHVATYFADKDYRGTLPDSVPADRVLLVDVQEYGAYVTPGKDYFLILAKVRVLDRKTGRTLWNQKYFREKFDLSGKVEDLQADNQKGLKQGLNEVLEKFCQKVKNKMAEARL